MDTVNRCVLTFDTNLDSRRTMSISNPIDGIDADVVSAAAVNIIAANLHDEIIGRFTSLHRADLVSTSTNILF